MSVRLRKQEKINKETILEVYRVPPLRSEANR